MIVFVWVVSCVLIAIGLMYVCSPTIMSHHEKFLGKKYDDLDPKTAALLLHGMKSVGGCFLLAGVILGLLAVSLPEEHWVLRAVLFMLGIAAIPVVYAMRVSIVNGAGTVLGALSLFPSFIRLFVITVFYSLKCLAGRIFRKKEDQNVFFGTVLKSAMLRLGPLFIKAGQLMATRSDIFTPEITDVLKSLHDDVPPMKEKYVQKILCSSYKMSSREIQSSIFSEFDMTPIASASIAQVHKARLRTGEVVAVKIVKHNVRDDLQKNLVITHGIIKFLSMIVPFFKKEQVSDQFAQIRKLLLNQAMMSVERRNQQRMYENLIGHPYVRIPKLYEEWCTEDVLVMDYVEGIPGKDPHLVNLDRKQIARRLQDTVYTMLFMHGFCHGDPHPGNFFYSPEGDILLVDFGIVVELTEEEKWGLASYMYACIRKEWDLAIERFTKTFVVNQENIQRDWDGYYAMLEPIFKKHYEVVSRHWSVINFLGDMYIALNKYQAHYTHNLHKAMLVFLSCEGVAMMVDPDIDIWENARKFTDRFSPYMSEEVKSRFDNFYGAMIPASIRMRDDAKNYLVAPTHLDRYVLPSTYPLFVASADGCKLTDIDGNIYVDLSCGYGPHILGYNHPHLRQAIVEASGRGSVNALAHENEVELAKLITEALPSADKVIFCNSGTEAVIMSLRICRGYRGRSRIAKFEGHYHGFSDQSVVSSWFRFAGDPARPEPFGIPGTQPEVVRSTVILQYGQSFSLDEIRRLKDELACVIIEPMPTGIAEYDIPFLKELRNICTQYDIPLVFDEVVSGFRVAYSGVQGITGVEPDITCLGKVIGGGLPCGAVAGKSQLIDIAKTTTDPFTDLEKKVFVGGTMSGNSITCASGKAMLTYLRDNPGIYDDLNQKTDHMKTMMSSIAAEHNIPFKISARHTIFSMSFNHKSFKFFREKMLNCNFKANIALAYYMRKHGVYMPELHTMFLSSAHTQEDLDIVCNSFSKSLEEMWQDNFFVS